MSKWFSCFLLYVILDTQSAFASRKNMIKRPASHTIPSLTPLPDYHKISLIEAYYKKRIEPIFENKCFSCHSSNHSEKHWLNHISYVSELFKKNKKKSRKELDLSLGFPFVGRSSQERYINKIEVAIKNKHMPPLWWNLFNWNNHLSELETNSILEWTRTSKIILKTTSK